MTASVLNVTLKASVMMAAGLALSACGDGRAVRGYVFDPQLADAIQPGVDNRISVESTLGTPTIKATFDDSTWYYVSTQVRIRPVFWPDPKEHRVLVVGFNDRGVVSSVNNLGLEDMREIEPVGDKTPTKGRRLNFFEQIFGSIGRFSGQAPTGSGENRGPNG
ncbi:outer membrane protein assembly factor BamE [Kordiimonas aquimaris]|uniref:outer membrane protein assembly factor BamE n=1 Tax=Kordiimonas aquimaris TaxID=707591 RepID=UPI0021D0EA32|nr:outer membrane protein assembly factor BamE [Kordiimonas aquimaris]